VYLPEHFKKPQYLKEIADNAYARARFDSVIIDAKNERAFVVTRQSLSTMPWAPTAQSCLLFCAVPQRSSPVTRSPSRTRSTTRQRAPHPMCCPSRSTSPLKVWQLTLVHATRLNADPCCYLCVQSQSPSRRMRIKRSLRTPSSRRRRVGPCSASASMSTYGSSVLI